MERIAWERRMGQCEGRGWLLAGSDQRCPVLITGLRLFSSLDSVGKENGRVWESRMGQCGEFDSVRAGESY